MSARDLSFLSTTLSSSANNTTSGFVSGVLSHLSSRLSQSISSLQLISTSTETNVGNYTADDGTAGIRISRRLVCFDMSLEDFRRGNRTRVCNACYIKVIYDLEYETGVMPYKHFSQHYRQQASDLAKVLLQHPLIRSMNEVPSCPHESLLHASPEDASEVARPGKANVEAYCLWWMGASYHENPEKHQLMDLWLICFDEDLKQLKKKALYWQLTKEQRSYVNDYVGQTPAQEASRCFGAGFSSSLLDIE